MRATEARGASRHRARRGPPGRWRATLVALLGLGAGCREALAPLPDGAESFAPPPVYARWWQMVETCSGLRGSLEGVRFFQVPGVRVIRSPSGREAEGYWSSGGNRIVLAGALTEVGALVRHEMLHALVRGAGHPREYYLRRCAGEVVCAGACVRDGGPTPAAPAGTRVVGPQTMTLAVVVAPEPPARTVNDGFFTVALSVRNPSDTPVEVRLAASPYGGIGILQATVTRSLRRHELLRVIEDAESLRLAPGEERRWYFDLRVGDVWTADLQQTRVLVTPGPIAVAMTLGGRSAPVRGIEVQP